MRPLPLLLLVVLLLPLARPLSAEEPEPAAAAAPAPVTEDERDAAIRRAFAYLDENLAKRMNTYPAKKVFTTAVAGWAYLLAGDRGGKRLPSRKRELPGIARRLGQYVDSVHRWHDGDRNPDADARAPGGIPGMTARGMRPMQYCWPLSVTGLFWAECGKRGVLRAESRENLGRIVGILEAAQEENGGWGHDDSVSGIGGMPLPVPDPTGRRARMSYPKTLLSVSNAVAPSLALARKALRRPPGDSVAKALGYFEASQQVNGAFPYDPSQKGTGDVVGDLSRRGRTEGMKGMWSTFAPRTAGAHFAMLVLGVDPGSDRARRAAAFVDAHHGSLSEGHGSASYGLMLSALDARIRGDAAWRRFRAAYFRRLLDVQQPSGGFRCACRESAFGTTCDSKAPGGMSLPGYVEDNEVYATAIHTLILMLDRTSPRVLPKPRPAARAVATEDGR